MHDVILLQVEKIEVFCELCAKKCKSKRGLKRHKTMKHKDSIQEISFQNQVESCVEETKAISIKSLTTDDLVTMVEEVKLKLSKTMIYQERMREELKSYTFIKPREDSRELEVLKEL